MRKSSHIGLIGLIVLIFGPIIVILSPIRNVPFALAFFGTIIVGAALLSYSVASMEHNLSKLLTDKKVIKMHYIKYRLFLTTLIAGIILISLALVFPFLSTAIGNYIHVAYSCPNYIPMLSNSQLLPYCNLSENLKFASWTVGIVLILIALVSGILLKLDFIRLEKRN